MLKRAVTQCAMHGTGTQRTVVHFSIVYRTVRHGNGFVLDVKKCPVYSKIRSRKIKRTFFLNGLLPPYLLGFRIHSRVTRST